MDLVQFVNSLFQSFGKEMSSTCLHSNFTWILEVNNLLKSFLSFSNSEPRMYWQVYILHIWMAAPVFSQFYLNYLYIHGQNWKMEDLSCRLRSFSQHMIISVLLKTEIDHFSSARERNTQSFPNPLILLSRLWCGNTQQLPALANIWSFFAYLLIYTSTTEKNP